MTLVKLDSGSYVNTTFVEWIEKRSDGWLISMAADSICGAVTSADKDRIVAAMTEADNE